MSRKKKKGPGTAGPYGEKNYGDQKMQNFPVNIHGKWVVKGPPPVNEQPKKNKKKRVG